MSTAGRRVSSFERDTRTCCVADGPEPDTVSMRNTPPRASDIRRPMPRSGETGAGIMSDANGREKPQTRRRKSLSDKQLAILEVIQRSIARARLPAEHARDRRRRRPQVALERHAPAQPARAQRLPPAGRRQDRARWRCSSTCPACRPRTRPTRLRASATRRWCPSSDGSPPACRSPPSSRSRRSSRSPASSSARATCSC